MTEKLRVLIVEDSSDDAELMLLRLSEQGFELDWQRVETEAAYLDALDTLPDLILVDWSLPQFSGLRALHLMRQRGLDIPFLIVSGSVGEEAAVDALHQGAHDYVLKDRPARLGQAVQRALEEKRLREDRRRAEEALRENQALLEATQRLAKIGGWEWDVAAQTMNWTEEVYRIHDMEPGEIAPLSPEHIDRSLACYETAYRPLIMDAFQRCVEQGQPYDLELLFRTVEGRQLWIRTVAQPVMKEGRVVKVIGHMMDITDRKQAELDLLASERKLKSIFSAAPVGIGHVKDRVILEANDALLSMTGYTREALIGHDARILYPTDEDYEYVGREKYGQVAEYGVGTVETRWQRKDGSVIDVILSSAYLDADDLSKGLTFTALDITDRKSAETALEDTLFELSTIYQNVPIAMMLVDRERRVRKVNGAAAALAGSSGDEMIGQVGGEALRCLNALDDPQGCGYGPQCEACLIRQAMLDTFEDQKSRDGIVTWLPFPSDEGDDGVEEKCLQVSTAYLRFDEDERVLVCIQDITERKRAEEALRELKEFNEGIVQSISEGIVVTDAQGVILFVNPALAVLLGYTPGELVGQPWLSFVPPGQQAIARAADKRRAAGQSDRYELGLQRKDGAPLLALVSGNPRFDAQTGRFVGTLAVFTDITARKQAEAEREKLLAQIQAQARQVQQIINSVPEGVLLLDAVGRVLLANPVSKRYLAILASGDSDRITRLGDRSLSELLTSPPKGLRHEVRAGGRLFEVIARPTDMPEPAHWVLVIHDATQERQVREQLHLQERLAAIGQLAAGIAHDFNNIMAVIILHAQTLGRLSSLSEQAQQQLETINQQARHATRLIQQILDFSRQSVLERQPLDLLPLLKEQVRMLKRALPEHIEIELTYGRGEHTVQADPTRMQQLVMNLAVNARDAMPDGGKLRLALNRVTVEPDASPPIRGMTPGAWVQLSVSDTGVGISPEALPHIYEPFYTTKAPGQGSGLGLAQVHGIVGHHDGHIGVETEASVGTTFTVYLPALRTPATVRITPDLDEVPTGRGEVILVVEDNGPLRAALRETLKQWNYHVVEAIHGAEALALLDEPGNAIDLVLSDVVMPTMGGVALAQALRQRAHRGCGPDLPVILMSGHAHDQDLSAVRALGVRAWLSKPPTLDQLAQALANALRAPPADE